MFIEDEWYIGKILYYKRKPWEYKLKVIQLKHKNINTIRLIRRVIKIMEYDVKLPRAMVRVSSVEWIIVGSDVVERLSMWMLRRLRLCCSNLEQSIVVLHLWVLLGIICETIENILLLLTYFGYYCYGLLRCVNIHAVNTISQTYSK
jgi:hypothetical protein